MPFITRPLAGSADTLAPDGSEIRLLVEGSRGSMVHCTLLPGRTSLAVRHQTVEEVWYILQGVGQLWRAYSGEEEETDLVSGISVTIPTGTHFQFRNTGAEFLCILICTMPPWPGADEAIRVANHWDVIAET